MEIDTFHLSQTVYPTVNSLLTDEGSSLKTPLQQVEKRIESSLFNRFSAEEIGTALLEKNVQEKSDIFSSLYSVDNNCLSSNEDNSSLREHPLSSLDRQPVLDKVLSRSSVEAKPWINTSPTVHSSKFSQDVGSPMVGLVDYGFDLSHVNVEFSNITLGADRVDGDDNPLASSSTEGDRHGASLMNVIGSLQSSDQTGNGGSDLPLWLGKAIGSGEWAESLVEFVDTAKAKGHERAIANLSFDLVRVDKDGNTTPRNALTDREYAALQYAKQNNVIVVAAAGNNNQRIGALGQASTLFDNVITVGTAENGRRASYSNYGNGLDILANTNSVPTDRGATDRGLGISSDDSELTGTSVAAATVSGVMATLWRSNPSLNSQQVVDLIKTTATDVHKDGWDRKTGAGLLNPAAALAHAQRMEGRPIALNDAVTDRLLMPKRLTKRESDFGTHEFTERALSGPHKTALLVADGRNLAQADRAIKARLESSGYTVILRGDEEVKSSDATGKDMIVISESVVSNEVGQTFTNVDVPVLNMEPFLYDDLKMTGTTKGKDFGLVQNNTVIRINAKSHAIASGLTDTVTVYKENGAIGWGNPNNNAIEIASVWGDAQGDAQAKSTIFGYEAGAMMAGGKKAPSRRAGLYLMNADGEANTLTSSGWKLFDSAVQWLTGNESTSNSTPTTNHPVDSNPTRSKDAIAPEPKPSGDKTTAPTTTPQKNGISQPNPLTPSPDKPLSQPVNKAPAPEAMPEATPEATRGKETRTLLVTGSTNLSPGDRALQSRLQSMGHTVTLKDDHKVQSSDANNQDVVVISESVLSFIVGDTFTRSDIPIVTLEPNLYDDLKLTGNRPGKDFGFLFDTQAININDTDHPLSAQSSPSTQVYTRPGAVSWGTPNDNAVDIASVKGDRTKSTLFGYEKGATLVDGSAAANNRVGLFLSHQNNEGQSMSNQGWSLFDAALDWATDNSTPASPSSPDKSSNPSSEQPLDEQPSGPQKPIDSIERDILPDPVPTSNDLPTPPTKQEKANGEFQVIDNKIYDPSGQEFIVKGVNKFTFDQGSSKQVDQIKNDWQFNTVRLNYFLEGQNGQQLYRNVDSYSKNKVVTIVELHDRTGKYWEGSDLTRLKSWFKDFAKRYKDNPYVWFNIANEPGGSKSVQQVDKWLKQHQEVIKVIRNEVGASNPIVVDAHFWGQDVGEWNSGPVKDAKSSIITYGDQLKQFGGKTYDNIIFSVHMYDQWNFGEAKMADYLDRIEDQDHAVIIGEYGQINTTFSTQKATAAMFNVTAPREIGRIAWVWSAKDSNDLTTTKNGGGEHINHENNPTNLSWLGQKIWKDNRRQEDLEQL